MTAIQTFQNSSFKVQCVCVDGNPWFRGKDVATVLAYKNPLQAVRVNVDEDDRKTLCDLLATQKQGVLPDSTPQVQGAIR